MNSLADAIEEAQDVLDDVLGALIRAIQVRPGELEADARSLLFSHARQVELPEPQHLAPLPVLVDVPALDYAESTEADLANRMRSMLIQLQAQMTGNSTYGARP